MTSPASQPMQSIYSRRLRMAATDRFDVPPEMRAFAEKSVEQARQAFDGFISAAHHAVNTLEGQAHTARLRAKDIQDVMKLQADYIKQQMQAFSEQAKELGESTTKAAKEAATPKR